MRAILLIDGGGSVVWTEVDGGNRVTVSNISFSDLGVPVFEIVPKPILSDYNLTNGWSGASWDNVTPYQTNITNVTYAFNTDFESYCAIGITDSNYTDMNSSRNCTIGEGLTAHSCTLISEDSLIYSTNNQSVYISCIHMGSPTNQLASSSSGALDTIVYSEIITIQNSPDNGDIFYAISNLNLTFNCSAVSLTDLTNISLYITDKSNGSFGINQTTQISISNTSNWTLTLEEGNYTWSCLGYDDGSWSDWTVNRSFQFDLLSTNLTIHLNGLEQNRTYEYGTTADLTKYSVEISCWDIYMPDYGLNYTCNDSLDLPLVDYESKTTLKGGVSFDELFFRIINYTIFYATLPTFLTLISAKADIIGLQNSLIISIFDDWNESQEEKTYEVINSIILNISVRDSKTMTKGSFYIQSSEAYNLSVDVCNNGTVNKNIESFFTFATFVELNKDDLNDCINDTTDDIFVIPINISFSIGGNITFSEVDFRVSTQSYPSEITIDSADEGLDDISLTESLSGSTGSNTQFTDGNTSKSLTINLTIRNSSVYYVNIPSAFETSSFVLTITPTAYEDVFSDSFTTADYINSSTDAIRNSYWDYYSQKKSGSLNVPSYIYSELVHTSTDTITSATLTADDDFTTAIQYFVSVDNGSNFESVTSGTEHQFTNTGKNVKWYSFLNTAGSDASYIYFVNITGLGDYPKNLSIDINNDGITDYSKNASIFTVETITLSNSLLDDFRGNCTDSSCPLPINISFIGKGTLTTSISYGFSTLNSDLNKDAINAYTGDAILSKTYITIFNDSSSSQHFTNFTNETVYVNVTKDVVINLFKILLTGGWHE